MFVLYFYSSDNSKKSIGSQDSHPKESKAVAKVAIKFEKTIQFKKIYSPTLPTTTI